MLAEPFDVLDAGRMAFAGDPTGGVFGVWQAGAHKGAQLVNEPGTWNWSELATRDVATARAFYSAVFGWASEELTDVPGGYHVQTIDGHRVAGILPDLAGDGQHGDRLGRLLLGRGCRRLDSKGAGARRHGRRRAVRRHRRPDSMAPRPTGNAVPGDQTRCRARLAEPSREPKAPIAVLTVHTTAIGTVARCSSCEAVVMVLVTARDATRIDLRGITALDVA